MCEAFEQQKTDGIKLGRSEGIAIGRSEGIELGRVEGRLNGRQEMYVEICQEDNVSYEETLERFRNKFHTSESETKQIVDQYWIFH